MSRSHHSQLSIVNSPLPTGYKQTEVGVIPEEWVTCPLQDIVDRNTPIAYGVLKPGDYVRNGIPLLQIRDVIHGGIDVDELHRISSQLDCQYSRTRLAGGEIVVSLVGTIGRVALIPMTLAGGNLHRNLGRVHVSGKYDPKFIFYFLNSDVAQAAIKLTTFGSTQALLNLADLRGLLVVVPPLLEQRAIATALSDVDALLGALDRLIAKKRDLKQAAMQQLLTGQTRLPGFHGEWDDAQVQDVIAASFCGPSPTCEERNIQNESEWGVLKTTAATKENGWDWTKHKTLPRVFWNKPHIELKKGDVIVTKAGPRHRVGVTAWVNYVPSRIIPSGKMIALRPRSDKVVPLMLAAAISARDAQTYLDQRTTGMAESQVNFENSALLEAPIRIPRIGEQTAIAAVLTDMDAELAVLEQRQAKTRALKQGMMQELLTGRTRLV